ncbi:TonB-dependent receptor family protein [Brevundimonas sp.]|uniref:TonB-dependent receptor family protein n=1 Tax=Brevundimonas sp. TaxID=1871086 RepID=UPI002D3D9EAE|nr:TonB-dependent receptor [Brevundimonas sp.]HYC67312.1 TonB-dependent receptor [Brevundimonas sp.]
MFATSASAAALLLALAPGPDAAPADPVQAFAAMEDPVDLGEVVITAPTDPLSPRAVSAARYAAQETPGAVAVVSREQYADHMASHLGDAMHGVPGVYAQKRWGEEVRLSIRGSGIGNSAHNRGVVIAQDGVPFNQADGFGDFQEIDLLGARYIEVWKGGNALRFGGAAMGGAIELNTPTGRNAPADNALRLEAGSFGTRRAHGEIAREWGDWDLWAGATVMAADGFRDHSAQASQRLSLNLGRSFGEGREVRLLLSAADIENDIPGALELADALSRPTMATPASVAGDYGRDMQVLRGSLQAHWRLGGEWTFDGGVYAAVKDLDHPISVVIDQQSLNSGAFGRFDWTGQLGSRRADLFFGAWLRRGELEGRTFQNLGGARGALIGDNLQTATALDVFAEGRLFVTDSLALVAGGSWGVATRDYEDRRNPARDESRDFDWFAPRLGVLWEGEGGQQVYANVTRSVEPPQFSALVQAAIPEFVPVEAQTAWTAEIGTRGRRGPLAWDVAVYRMAVENELLTFLPGPDIPATTFNAGDTIHQGIEAGLDWAVWKGEEHALKLHQTWAWSDFRFDGDARYGDGRMPVMPEHHYHAELSFGREGVWSVAPSLEWASDGWVDYANTLRSPGHMVWSLNATWTVTPQVRLFLDARNLTDETYVSNASAVTDARVAPTAVFWPGEGRSAFVGLRTSF